MKTRLLTSVLLGLFMPLTALAQLSGVRLPTTDNSSTVSNATYAVEMTLANGDSTITAKNTDTVTIMGTVRPESAHIGQQGDLFVVDYVNQVWTMRAPDGAY